MTFARVVGVCAALAAELDHGRVVEAAQASVVRIHARVEEHPAVARVCIATVDQPRNPFDHLLDVLGRARCDVDRDEADRRHVVVEHAHLFRCKGSKFDAALARDTQDVVINVGDVPHAPHRDAGVAEAPVEDVEHVIDERVAEVRRVVRRDAADVDADASAPRLEGHHLLAGGVEQLHAARFYGALAGTPCGCSGSRMLRAASRTAMLFLKVSRAFAASNPNQPASAISAGSGWSSVSGGASTMK